MRLGDRRHQQTSQIAIVACNNVYKGFRPLMDGENLFCFQQGSGYAFKVDGVKLREQVVDAPFSTNHNALQGDITKI